MVQNTLLVTGAAGFIGSQFLRTANENKCRVIVLDAMTYAGHLENIEELIRADQVVLEKGRIEDFSFVLGLLKKYQPHAIVNFAAESHVDNSISGPKVFIETNVMGTFGLLEAFRSYYGGLNPEQQRQARFVHVSTDEVFGALGLEGKFSEQTAYAPNSPYSASKAASDMLVRAWHHTYGLPTLITNCSNNYGPRQFPEKLIPLMIDRALNNKALPVYGSGKNVRDWIHVEDHCNGVWLALTKGIPGTSYCFGGNSEKSNIEVVKAICERLDELRPRPDGKKHETGIQFVEDRKGHDFRYAIDDSFAQKNLGFSRKYKNFEMGLAQTISWYLDNQSWVSRVTSKKG